MSKRQVRLNELKNESSGKQDLLEIWDLYNTQILIGVVGVILIFFAAVFAIKSTRQATENRWQRLGAIYSNYDQALQSPDEELRTEELEGVLLDCRNLYTDAGNSVPGREALFVQGQVQLVMGDMDKALASFMQYISLAETNNEKAAGNIAMGIVLADSFFLNGEQFRFTSAKEAFEEARDLGSSNNEAQWNAYGREAMMRLAILYEQNKQYAEARKIFEDLSQLPAFDEEMDRIVAESKKRNNDEDERMSEAAMYREQYLSMRRSMTYREMAKEYLKTIPEPKANKAATPGEAKDETRKND